MAAKTTAKSSGKAAKTAKPSAKSGGAAAKKLKPAGAAGKATAKPKAGKAKSVGKPAGGKATGTLTAKAKGKAGGKAEAGQVDAAAADGGEDSRKLGLRGAAPWAARHAAKHAAEARARAAEPPLPGSARATIRTPQGAEDIKIRISALHNTLTHIRTLRKNLPKGFFDIGIALREVQSRKLFEAKGFGSFDTFLEREMDLGKATSLRLMKISQFFQREAALELGMDKLFAAVAAMEMEALEARPSGKIPPPPISTSALPMKPPGRF